MADGNPTSRPAHTTRGMTKKGRAPTVARPLPRSPYFPAE